MITIFMRTPIGTVNGSAHRAAGSEETDRLSLLARCGNGLVYPRLRAGNRLTDAVRRIRVRKWKHLCKLVASQFRGRVNALLELHDVRVRRKVEVGVTYTARKRN